MTDDGDIPFDRIQDKLRQSPFTFKDLYADCSELPRNLRSATLQSWVARNLETREYSRKTLAETTVGLLQRVIGSKMLPEATIACVQAFLADRLLAADATFDRQSAGRILWHSAVRQTALCLIDSMVVTEILLSDTRDEEMPDGRLLHSTYYRKKIGF